MPNEIIAIVSTVAIGAKTLLVFLEAVEKRGILKTEFAGYPPEATAGFYSRSLFWWLNPLFRIGYSNVLSVRDLFILDKELSSERLLAMFEERWSKGTSFFSFFNKPNRAVTDSPSEIKITQHFAIPVFEGCQVAPSGCDACESMRCGI